MGVLVGKCEGGASPRIYPQWVYSHACRGRQSTNYAPALGFAGAVNKPGRGALTARDFVKLNRPQPGCLVNRVLRRQGISRPPLRTTMTDEAGEGQLPSLFSPVQQTIVKEFGQHINATRLKAAAVAVITDEFVFNRESFSAPNLHLDSVVNVVKSVSVNLNFGAPTPNPTAPPVVTKEHYYPEFLPSSLFMSGKDKVKLFDTAAKENRSSRAPPEAPVPVYVHRRMMRPFAPTELQAYKDMATATKQHDTNTSILMHETGKRELNGNAMHQRSVQLAMDRKTMRHKFRTLNELDEEIGTSAAHFVEHGKFAERKVKRVRKAARSQSQLNTRPKSFYCVLHDYLRDHKLRLVDLFHKIDGKRVLASYLLPANAA